MTKSRCSNSEVSFTWSTDIDPAAVKGYERYYGVSNKGFAPYPLQKKRGRRGPQRFFEILYPKIWRGYFASYLGTLGLRTYAGEDKDAFRALGEEVEKRGW